MFPEKKDYKSDHVILDRKTHEHDLKDFSFTFLELTKFHKGIDDLGSISEKWMYFFKHAEETKEEDLAKIIGQDAIIARAYKELNRFTWKEEELLTYEQEEKYKGAYIASMEQKYDEGMAKGIEKGRLQEKLEIAKAMLSKGMSPDTICAVTQLREEEIKKIN